MGKTSETGSYKCPEKLSDKDLYCICKIYGKNARKWQRKFAFLLPEVAKRNLHRKYGYESIFHFAFKLGSMNRDLVCRVLNLYEKLIDKSLIWSKFEKHGWTKLRTIADIVKIDTQDFWLDKLEKCPFHALEEYVKIWKNKNGIEAIGGNLQMNICEAVFVRKIEVENREKSLHKSETGLVPEFANEFEEKLGHKEMDQEFENFTCEKEKHKQIKFWLNDKSEFQFKKLKKDMEREKKQCLTMGETLIFMMEKIEFLEEENERLGKENKKLKSILGKTTKKPKRLRVFDEASKKLEEDNQNDPIVKKNRPNLIKAVSRYIPAKIKKVVINKYQGRCAFPNCNEPFEELHHSERFALVQNHENLKPLCHAHHHMMHAGVVNEKREDLALMQAGGGEHIEQIDAKVRSFWDSG